MITVCPAVPSGPGFLAGVLRSTDCLALGAAERSFAFLSAPGGLAASLLVAAMTMLIAIFGFRLMFSVPVGFGDVTAAALRIGIALAIATSWPAVSRVIAGPVLNGPAELTRWTGITSALPERLGNADAGIGALTSWGTGRNDPRAQRTAGGDYAANEAATVALTDAFAFGFGRTAFLVGAVGSLGLLKLLAGILIGLAPIFAGLLLFERTQGIFAGWLRALLGLLVAGAAANVLLAAQLALLEPWLAGAVASRQASLATPSAASELLALTLSFSLITFATIALIFRFMLSLELPVLRILNQIPADAREALAPSASPAGTGSTLVSNDNSRRSARTVEAVQRIDSFRDWAQRSSIAVATVGQAPGADGRADGHASQGGQRRPRRTLVGQRRDRRA